jgi:hypothetical protein
MTMVAEIIKATQSKTSAAVCHAHHLLSINQSKIFPDIPEYGHFEGIAHAVPTSLSVY